MKRSFGLMAALVAFSMLVATVVGAGQAASLKKKKKPVPRYSTLTGTWTGQYSGGYNGTFTLQWTETKSTLNGTITLSSPKGTYNVGGSVNGGTIKFGAVAVGATYMGSVSGTTMSGTYQALPKGGSWSAKKVS